MRFREFAARDHQTEDRLRTCVLYVPEGCFPDLTACRLLHGRPTRIRPCGRLHLGFRGARWTFCATARRRRWGC
jgi:hypothetical protein